jgi:hypothetical protein
MSVSFASDFAFSLSLDVCVSFKLSSYKVLAFSLLFFFSSSSVYRLLLINFDLFCHCHLLSPLLSLSLPPSYVLFFFADDAKMKIHIASS